MTKTVDLSVYIGVGGCWWTSYSSVVFRGVVVFPLWNIAPNLASADDATT